VHLKAAHLIGSSGFHAAFSQSTNNRLHGTSGFHAGEALIERRLYRTNISALDQRSPAWNPLSPVEGDY